MSSTQQLLLGEGAGGAAPVFIEDVFSCFLYTGTGSSQTITNNIDLSTKGGLTWIKGRSGTTGHRLTDTARGATKSLASETTAAEATETTGLTAFGTTGFTIGADADYNTSAATYVSWTFRKQPKFFDIVTWTGDSTSGRTVAHNLGSVPGCIIVKCTSNAVGGGWPVYHRSLGNTQTAVLNTTDAAFTFGYWNNTTPTSTVFTLNGDSDVNGTGKTYVAYLFAHDSGGFGLTGTDNVISCGSFSVNGAGSFSVNLGYEPQWVMIKSVDNTSVSAIRQNWIIYDTMRNLQVQTQGQAARLLPNSDAEESSSNEIGPTATGFESIGNQNPSTGPYIYIAIRRGPMKTPTDPTKVFAMATAVGTEPAFVSNAVVDMGFNFNKTLAGLFVNQSRLMGAFYLNTRSTDAEVVESSRVWDYMNGMLDGQTASVNNVGYMFGRAPGFFDVACYTGNGATQNISHNLGVAPELMIVKKRSVGGTSNWCVYATPLANVDAFLFLNEVDAVSTASVLWNSTAPTNTVFSLGGSTNINQSGQTCIAYLFATLAGISKVGSYTGNGTTQTINCGFPSGVRWVMIKRTDTTSGWYVYDTLRGMTVLTDPYVFTNAPAAAEVATLGSVTTVATGFALDSAILAAINVSAGNYIFLAFA